MIELKTVIDKNGYIVDNCVEIEDGKTNYFTMTEGQKTVDKYSNVLKYVKPKWNCTQWVEGATDEEIQASKEDIIESELSPTLESRVQSLEDALLQSLDLGE